MQTNRTQLHAQHELIHQQGRIESQEGLTITYDGSFNGFLTAIWHARKLPSGHSVKLEKNRDGQTSFFKSKQFLLSNQAVARQMWHELEKSANPSARLTYFAFLSEKQLLTKALFFHLSQTDYKEIELDEELKLHLQKASQEVQKEKQLLEKSTILRKSNNHLWYAELRPRTNVIPLLSKRIRQRYPGSDWFIWDSKRHYGLLCDNGKCSFTNKRLHLRSAMAS